MPKQSYMVLAQYLQQISADYGLHICINDFSGFVFMDKELTELLQPYMIHSNPYCMMVKSDKRLWDKCQSMKKPIAEKCRVDQSIYYGMCHGGVEEYILPIFYNGQLIGTVHAGVFRSHNKAGERCVKKLAHTSFLNESTLLKLYRSSLREEVPEADKIKGLLGIGADYLGRIYEEFTVAYPSLLNQIRFNTNEDNILSHTLEYIKRNYSETISVKDIADFCHCSISYINHSFKKRMKVNIREYINILRVDAAKTYLNNTDLPVKEVALKVGYLDSNYFCKVFSGICGISPTGFRKEKGRSAI